MDLLASGVPGPARRHRLLDLEVLSGGVCAGLSASARIAVPSPGFGWITDPLVPGTAVQVYGDVGPSGEPGLDQGAFADIEYGAVRC
ncbi:hypothetical protein [Sinomonas sp. P47F7]|uniref:hypothetical protein n=1 Tax=Sinomonas sp. P47F7 TaxID=3410987 RepID=UPI003BF50FA2